jgi:hypothetical protein
MEKHSKWFLACPSWNSKTLMHRTPSSLRGRLDKNNLRTSETKIMNQSMTNFGTMHIKLRMATMLS